MNFALFVFRKIFVKVLDDVGKDVQSDQIEGPERGALRTADCRAGHLIDLFDQVTVVEHRPDRVERAERADAIRDEVGSILCGHDAFAQSLIEEAVEKTRHFRLCPFRPNDFDEMEITRRVEKMDTDEMLFEVVRTTFGK